MKKFAAFIVFLISFYCYAMDSYKAEQESSDKRITLVINEGENILLDKEGLQGIFPNNNIVQEGKTLITEMLPNEKGQYDITLFIQQEHLLINARKLIIQTPNDSREVALQKIRFFVIEIPGLMDALISIASNVKKINNYYVFNLPAIVNKGVNYFDLSIICKEFYDTGYNKNQSNIKEIYKKREELIRQDLGKEKNKELRKKNDEINEKNSEIVNLKKEVENLKKASTKYLFCSFGLGASCIGFLWWLHSHA